VISADATAAPSAPAPSPAPGLDPGFQAYIQKKYPNGVPGGGATDIWGSETGADLVVKSSGTLHPNGTEPLMKISDVMYQFWQRDQKWVDALAAKLVKAGMLPGVNVTRSDVWEAFRKNILMEAATAYASSPDKAPTVEQVLQGFMKRPVGDAGANKPAHFTIPNTNMNISDPTQADAVLQDTLKQQLGWAPTDAEKHSFLAALNAAQRANPSVTSTEYTLDAKSGQYATKNTTTGGVDAGQFANDFMDKNKSTERGAFQAATTYFDAMMGALGTPGGI
jgi:hypothetical protein